MPRHCPFPVRSNDNRCGYHTGCVPGLCLWLALAAVLACFAGFSHATAGTATQEKQVDADVAIARDAAPVARQQKPARWGVPSP